MAEKDPQRCLTPRFRASFVHVFRPQKPLNENQDPKYGITMLFEKGADLSKLQAAAKAAAVEKWGPDKSKWPKNLRSPFRDQAEKADQYDGYVPGAIFMNATTKQKPGLVNENAEDIIEPSEFYSGCYAHATVRFFAYDTAGNRGIGAGLDNIQKLADGEPLGGGRPAPQDDFSPASDEPSGADDDDPLGESSSGDAAGLLD